MKAQATIKHGSGPYPYELWVTCEDLRHGEPGKEERRVRLYSRHELRKDAVAARPGAIIRAEAAFAALAGDGE